MICVDANVIEDNSKLIVRMEITNPSHLI
uniref:Uncharacterized protein n=1 Tax=Rhizophora mucronata TaxID=61149 RepID=A0A2P2NGF6_RHIMU